MWRRRTFHECAEELTAISEDFRAAHVNRFGWDTSRCDRIKAETSRRGVEILRVLALAVRGEQDAGLIERDQEAVIGAVVEAAPSDIDALMRDYRPPYSRIPSSSPAGLREGLNKIAHADPRRAGFWADNENHELLLCGERNGRTWLAVISIIDLCRAITTLPDLRLPN